MPKFRVALLQMDHTQGAAPGNCCPIADAELSVDGDTPELDPGSATFCLDDAGQVAEPLGPHL